MKEEFKSTRVTKHKEPNLGTRIADTLHGAENKRMHAAMGSG